MSKLGIHADAEERYADAMRLHVEANALFGSVVDRGEAGYTLSRASMSAFGMGADEAALRLGRAGFGASSEVGNRWGMIAALCRIGFSALALGDPGEAAPWFGEALERARAADAVSLQLLALSGVGALLEQRGDVRRAAVALTFALGHEQLPGAYCFPARPALERVRATLPAEELDEVGRTAAETELEAMVADALHAVGA